MKIMNVVRKFGAPVAIAAATVMSASAFATGGSLDGATVTAVQTSVIADAGTASGAGFAVMTVVLSLSIGFGLLSKFISKGAKG